MALREGELEDAISRYKFQGGTGWATIFARIPVGVLELDEVFMDFDLIMPSPGSSHLGASTTPASSSNKPRGKLPLQAPGRSN